ncbi:MAG: MBL fold metallo-hydrolase [Candidatus Aminicenantia bacterium]
MKIGRITDRIHVIGNVYFPSYLIIGEKIAIIDAGVTVMGPIYKRDIITLTPSKSIDFLFLTHSHFDHCGAIPYLRRNLPPFKVLASQVAKEVFQKEKAIEHIKTLNKEIEDIAPPQKEDMSIDLIEVDIVLKEGDKIDLGEGIEIDVIETPGHTRCGLSFYISLQKAIFFGEAGGVIEKDGIIRPQFLSSFNQYVSSIEKMKKLQIEIIGLAHGGALIGKSAEEFLEKSLKETFLFKERIIDYLKKYSDKEKVIELIAEEDFKNISQPKTPYLLNLRASVSAIEKEFASEIN